MTKQDWQKHYQPLWGAFVSGKRHFDPAEILAPGQGIF
jgi:FAD/FMN-containing dehydrogenase